MLSFGIEYERAFSIAFCNARLLAGSAPPSRAATMIARASFEKSLPRLASAAPFLCLIEDHLLCPDTVLLFYPSEEELVHASVVGQLRVEGGGQKPAVADEHRLALQLGEDFDLLAHLAHPRRSDEDASQRPVVARELEIGLEARDLAAECVPIDLEVDGPEVITVEHDHSRAGAEDRPVERGNCGIQPVKVHQAHERGRFAAGDHEAVQTLQLLRLPDLGDVRAQAPEHRRVLAKVALEGEYADFRARAHAAILGATARAFAAVSGHPKTLVE